MACILAATSLAQPAAVDKTDRALLGHLSFTAPTGCQNIEKHCGTPRHSQLVFDALVDAPFCAVTRYCGLPVAPVRRILHSASDFRAVVCFVTTPKEISITEGEAEFEKRIIVIVYRGSIHYLIQVIKALVLHADLTIALTLRSPDRHTESYVNFQQPLSPSCP